MKMRITPATLSARRNNVYGGEVNIAPRISGLSAPGELLVSDIVSRPSRTSAGITFEDRVIVR